MKTILLTIISMAIYHLNLSAHSTHATQAPGAIEKSIPADNNDVFTDINKAYMASIKPIFQKKCFDCHSNTTHYPWYYRLPFVKQLIDRDIQEGLEHIDMSRGFPFGGHGTPQEDLEELREVVEKDEMPPWQYRLIHWQSSLTKADKAKILEWITTSQHRLKPKIN